MLSEAAAMANTKIESMEEDQNDDYDDDVPMPPPEPTKPPSPSPEAPAAVPETSSPGESQSNGDAERTIQRIEDMTRTLKLNLEDRIKAQIPCHHPMMAWIIDHASMLLTKCHRGISACTENQHVTGLLSWER